MDVTPHQHLLVGVKDLHGTSGMHFRNYIHFAALFIVCILTDEMLYFATEHLKP